MPFGKAWLGRKRVRFFGTGTGGSGNPGGGGEDPPPPDGGTEPPPPPPPPPPASVGTLSYYDAWVYGDAIAADDNTTKQYRTFNAAWSNNRSAAASQGKTLRIIYKYRPEPYLDTCSIPYSGGVNRQNVEVMGELGGVTTAIQENLHTFDGDGVTVSFNWSLPAGVKCPLGVGDLIVRINGRPLRVGIDYDQMTLPWVINKSVTTTNKNGPYAATTNTTGRIELIKWEKRGADTYSKRYTRPLAVGERLTITSKQARVQIVGQFTFIGAQTNVELSGNKMPDHYIWRNIVLTRPTWLIGDGISAYNAKNVLVDNCFIFGCRQGLADGHPYEPHSPVFTTMLYLRDTCLLSCGGGSGVHNAYQGFWGHIVWERVCSSDTGLRLAGEGGHAQRAKARLGVWHIDCLIAANYLAHLTRTPRSHNQDNNPDYPGQAEISNISGTQINMFDGCVVYRHGREAGTAMFQFQTRHGPQIDAIGANIPTGRFQSYGQENAAKTGLEQNRVTVYGKGSLPSLYERHSMCWIAVGFAGGGLFRDEVRPPTTASLTQNAYVPDNAATIPYIWPSNSRRFVWKSMAKPHPATKDDLLISWQAPYQRPVRIPSSSFTATNLGSTVDPTWASPLYGWIIVDDAYVNTQVPGGTFNGKIIVTSSGHRPQLVDYWHPESYWNLFRLTNVYHQYKVGATGQAGPYAWEGRYVPGQWTTTYDGSNTTKAQYAPSATADRVQASDLWVGNLTKGIRYSLATDYNVTGSNTLAGSVIFVAGKEPETGDWIAICTDIALEQRIPVTRPEAAQTQFTGSQYHWTVQPTTYQWPTVYRVFISNCHIQHGDYLGGGGTMTILMQTTHPQAEDNYGAGNVNPQYHGGKTMHPSPAEWKGQNRGAIANCRFDGWTSITGTSTSPTQVGWPRNKIFYFDLDAHHDAFGWLNGGWVYDMMGHTLNGVHDGVQIQLPPWFRTRAHAPKWPYDAVSGWQLRKEDAPDAVRVWEAGMAFDPENNRLIMHGGHTGIPQSNYTHAFNMVDNTWVGLKLNYRPQRMCIVELCYIDSVKKMQLSRGSVFHGSILEGVVNDAGTAIDFTSGSQQGPWMFDPATYVWKDMRCLAAYDTSGLHDQLAYDESSDIVVSSTGLTRAAGTKRLWIYRPYVNRTDQRRTNLPTAFENRLFYGISADPIHRCIVIYGGGPGAMQWSGAQMPNQAIYDDYVRGETWLYWYLENPPRLEELNPSPSPPKGMPGWDHQRQNLCYHKRLRRHILIVTPTNAPLQGPHAAPGSPNVDTEGNYATWPKAEMWAFDVQTRTWTKLAMPADAPDVPGLLTYDELNDQLVLFGGGLDGASQRPSQSNRLYTLRLTIPGAPLYDLPNPRRISCTVMSDRIRLAFTPAAGTTYDVYRAPVTANTGEAVAHPRGYVKITTTPISTSPYDDTTASRASSWAYRIAKANTDLYSLPAFNQLPLVENVRVQMNSLTSAMIRWDASPKSWVSGYSISRMIGNAANLSVLTPTPVTGTSYTDTTLSVSGGTIYGYVVYARDENGLQSGPSPVAWTRPDPVIKLKTTMVNAGQVGGSITLTWDYMYQDAGIAGVNIYRAPRWQNEGLQDTAYHGSFVKLNSTPVSGKTFTYTVTAIPSGSVGNGFLCHLFYVQTVDTLGFEGFKSDLIAVNPDGTQNFHFRPSV